ncbi:MAG: molybdenum ABC transporter ATP-binding protein [Gammaproteobacteria bacterium]|nr:molybdenum ABC transporter ATP-binding protein [Gammaproteobacteria bacterium]
MNATEITAQFQLAFPGFHMDIALSLPSSGISVIYGESGSGKTTLLRCMAGLERPKHGYFGVNGQIWQDSRTNRFIPTHRRNLGYVFQDANLFPHLTVLGNLEFGYKRAATKHNRSHFDHIVRFLSLDTILQRTPERLSGGERQRVAIARALVLNPDILLMDEPLASLDINRKREVMPYLLKLQQEFVTPVIYVTHSQREVMQLADYLVILKRGRVQANGSLMEMLSKPEFPFEQEVDAVSVWQGVVKSHDPEYQLSCIDVGGITLNVPLVKAEIGAQIRVLLQARDVSISLQAPMQTSIINVLPAKITGLDADRTGNTTVSLRCGANTLLALITRKSAHQLALAEGMPCFAQIKGVSLIN